MKRKFALLLAGIAVVVALVISIPIYLALANPTPVVLSASTAQSTLGGSWQVLENQTYLKEYPTSTISIYYANGTNVTVPYPHQVKSVDHEVLVGNINGTKVVMRINVITFTSNISFWAHGMMFGFHGGLFHHIFGYNVTTYDGYTVIYAENSFFYPHTYLLAYKGNTLIEINLVNFTASQQQMEEILSGIS
ncbi:MULTISPECIES: zinc ribbon domain-containing protein [Metallosphaera]|uniref:zinc ribbon domain-containing protein n=1 Tax=Metallosphaera TaxID=41980 RepID=UPI001F0629F4|nr:zinc ribbon domain-containing protein [Metallosphaera sedula]MCH1771101.1 zinc ribbon domain-containing protein [Metallosphaera sedula]MCP6729472.1 zinc ribbon domain-containing protein [Metallosphaera sedula]